MRRLAAKQNVDSPTGDFPYGRINDDDGTGIGTPVDETVYGDFHQFFERMMNEAGIVPNGMADSEYVGFQLFEAFMQSVSKRIGKYSVGDSLLETNTNLNNYKSPGCFMITSSYTNGPSGLGASDQLIVAGYGNSISQRIVDISDGAEWIRTWNGSVWSSWVLIRLGMKVLTLPVWDMDTDSSVVVPHGLSDHTKIRIVKGVIRNDVTNVTDRILEAAASDGTIQGGAISMDATNINVFRMTGGTYDTTAYNDTGSSRGILIVFYDK